MTALDPNHRLDSQAKEPGLSDNLAPVSFRDDDLPPFKYPKIDWEEWPEWETGVSQPGQTGALQREPFYAQSDTQHPDPAASHLLSEIGYASLPPPALEQTALEPIQIGC